MNGHELERLAVVESKVDSLVKGQAVILEKLDELAQDRETVSAKAIKLETDMDWFKKLAGLSGILGGSSVAAHVANYAGVIQP